MIRIFIVNIGIHEFSRKRKFTTEANTRREQAERAHVAIFTDSP